MGVIVVSVEASEAVAVTAEVEEMTSKCLRLFAANVVKIAKCPLGLPEINPCIAVIVLRKWETEAKGSRLTDQGLGKEKVRITNIKLNLKLLTPNWTKY